MANDTILKPGSDKSWESTVAPIHTPSGDELTPETEPEAGVLVEGGELYDEPSLSSSLIDQLVLDGL